MNTRDLDAEHAVPALMVPRFDEMERLTSNGQRFLVAANGLWLEARWDWMYLRTHVAPCPIALPYGEVTPQFRIEFDGIPEAILDEFIEAAVFRSPNRCAGWVVWNKEREEMMLKLFEGVSAGGVHLVEVRPELEEEEHIVCELRSKGRQPARFTEDDDKADVGDYKLAAVVGNCDGEVDFALRLCAAGYYLPLERSAVFRMPSEMGR